MKRQRQDALLFTQDANECILHHDRSPIGTLFRGSVVRTPCPFRSSSSVSKSGWEVALRAVPVPDECLVMRRKLVSGPIFSDNCWGVWPSSLWIAIVLYFKAYSIYSLWTAFSYTHGANTTRLPEPMKYKCRRRARQVLCTLSGRLRRVEYLVPLSYVVFRRTQTTDVIWIRGFHSELQWWRCHRQDKTRRTSRTTSLGLISSSSSKLKKEE